MKKFLTTIVILLFAFQYENKAQMIIENAIDTTEHISDKLYKFELRMPAQCIDKITYQKDNSKVDFELSEDGKIVYIKNFIPGRGIRVECTYKDGNRDAFNKSPCSLELVVPL